MPKRVIHGEGIWSSDKLARVEPTWVRPEYANLIPLALANGVFEANAKRIWSCVYSYNRPEITLEKVESILESLKAAGLLFIWSDSGSGKVWGFWIGIEKSGRLPSASRLKKGHDAVGPNPPGGALKDYVLQSMANQWPANGHLGSGSGLGSGSEYTTSSESEASDEQTPKPITANEPTAEGVKLAQFLRRRIVENNHSAKIGDKQEVKWAFEVDRMVVQDQRSYVAIREMIDFSQNDIFWRTVVLSMGTLRKQFDRLSLKHASASNPLPTRRPSERNVLTEEGRKIYAQHGATIE
jgi:hypothetical protein